MREIGSEFPLIKQSPNGSTERHWDRMGALVFSGRTAIETVLKNEPSIQKAALPSYCCDSMIEPFRKAKIEVCFYPVYYADGLKIDLSAVDNVDCILWCNYFGFCNDMLDLSSFRARGGIIIEDITHSLYSDRQYHSQSHYLVASVRKWEPVLCGGYCASINGELREIPDVYPPIEFLKRKKSAMEQKAQYLAGTGSSQKEDYLRMFAQSNHWLSEQYSGLMIDDYSRDFLSNVDFSAHQQRRRQNAAALYKYLRDCKSMRFLFDQAEMECPLFVPILIADGKRDAIRRKLIENQIYCPVHWPKPNADCESNLYDIELSLVCDQRYDANDMRRIADVLRGELKEG